MISKSVSERPARIAAGNRSCKGVLSTKTPEINNLPELCYRQSSAQMKFRSIVFDHPELSAEHGFVVPAFFVLEHNIRFGQVDNCRLQR